jgi:hypothetical protein
MKEAFLKAVAEHYPSAAARALKMSDPVVRLALSDAESQEKAHHDYADRYTCTGCAMYAPSVRSEYQTAPGLFVHLLGCEFYKKLIEETEI